MTYIGVPRTNHYTLMIEDLFTSKLRNLSTRSIDRKPDKVATLGNSGEIKVV